MFVGETAWPWGEYLAVTLWSVLKMMVGVALGAGFAHSFWERFVCTAVGGLLGTTCFTYFGGAIRAWWRAWRAGTHAGQPAVAAPPPPKAWQAALWRRFGLVGVALLTPPLLSPPGGAALGLAFGVARGRLVRALGASVLVWAALFAFLSRWDIRGAFLALLQALFGGGTPGA
jgi:hypothetical protein